MNNGTLIAVLVLIAAVVIVAVLLLARARGRMRKLSEPDRNRFAEAWRSVEARFIDDPRAAVQSADGLAVEILQARGARMDGKRAPKELESARQAARVDQERGGSDTEGYRNAMVRYQAIVDDAVGKKTRRSAETARREVA